MSLILSVYHLPKLFTGCSDNVGIGSLLKQNGIGCLVFLYAKPNLLNFGLKVNLGPFH